LFEELVEALVDEDVEASEFEVGSMRYAQGELLGQRGDGELLRDAQEGADPSTAVCNP